MKDNAQLEKLLEDHGIKLTVNRMIVAKTLASSNYPRSLTELEDEIPSIDKSSIFRTLTVFKEHHMVHLIEDGSNGVKYELCTSLDHHDHDDQHIHFQCRICHHTYCMEDIPVPQIKLPEGFVAQHSSYTVRGVCPNCLKYEDR